MATDKPVTAPILLSLLILLATLAACDTAPPDAIAPAAEPVAASLADYQRAEQFLAANTRELVVDDVLALYWQEDDRLVYRKSTAQGSELQIADLATGSKTGVVDPILLAQALAELVDEAPDVADLALSDIDISSSLDAMEFDYDSERFRVDLGSLTVSRLPTLEAGKTLSPDGSKVAYVEDYNLWVRDLASGDATQLTFDGTEHYGYATNNAGWIRDDEPVLLWSPDSSKIASFRHDGRQVGEMALYTTQVGHPEVDTWKYPLPGDEHIFMIERLVIHVGPEPRQVWLDMPADPHRSTTADHVADFDGRFLDVEWAADSQSLAFISSSRDHKSATLQVADANTGAVREVFNETVETYYESGQGDQSWRYFPERDQFLWYSERDNWGHLYLYDLQSGELQQQLTSGDWTVLRVLHVDRENEQLFFLGSNREPGDPYFHYLYRIDFDGSNLLNLTPEPGHHVISFSESGEYFVDRVSTPVQAPTVRVRDRDGNELMLLESADISALEESGWVPPQPFTVKARDGLTDLYGLLYQPSNLDTSKSYPVLNYLYPGPQTGSVGSRSFRASRNDKQALAELGFIVVEVDAMGTPGRSKSFHDAYYGNMGDNGLPDQITTIRQLAERNPWMDLDRVGIWGHSGGGFASTAGILRYPDFYKVAVSGAGNHDNRNYEDDWAEKWQGLLEVYDETGADGRQTTNYDNQANQLLAENLEGKLLLAHGLLDDNVHPSNTLLVVQALIEAEKDFDLLLLPDARHGFGNRRYFMKRRWDYFVRHLQGVEPPAEFRFADNIR
jgi:dipeptidyl aminopeptidase/acylaminoacyl peptidase